MNNRGEYGLTTHTNPHDETTHVSSFDRDCFEARKTGIDRTGFTVLPLKQPDGATRWLVKDRPGKFNWWKNCYKFKSEIEAVTWAWKAWEFKIGQRSRID